MVVFFYGHTFPKVIMLTFWGRRKHSWNAGWYENIQVLFILLLFCVDHFNCIEKHAYQVYGKFNGNLFLFHEIPWPKELFKCKKLMSVMWSMSVKREKIYICTAWLSRCQQLCEYGLMHTYWLFYWQWKCNFYWSKVYATIK
jgi:hypothetical protein